MNYKTILLSSAILALAACATTPKEEPAPIVQAEPEVQAPVAVAPPPPPPPPPVIAENTGPVVDLNAPLPGSAEDFVYQSGGDARVYFGYDQSTLSGQARDILRRQADWLNQYSNVTAVVEGNADERGTREYNLALGAKRADSVKSFLVSQGVAPNRLTTVSYGKERPIDGRSSEDGWSRNRNGHTNLMTGAVG